LISWDDRPDAGSAVIHASKWIVMAVREIDARTVYDANFYQYLQDGSLRSARTVVPMVLRLFPASSVIDIGCGVGAWLRAFAEYGITEIAGYDGGYVSPALLMIPPEHFNPIDLRQQITLPRRFDLAVSLEVAEHLPENCAPGFARLLTSAAPVVLFSAAIPGQGGSDHVNEQWQDYWRALFATQGYQPLDCIRPAIRGHHDVEYWYQQNIIVYCSPEVLQMRQDLAPVPHQVSLNLVHPDLYGSSRRPGFKQTIQMLPGLLVTALSKRLEQLRGGR
jgi:SAM-dependent methyltransferase